jgi:hypothetical protein
MSQKTTTTNSFAPSGMNAYNKMQPQLTGQLQAGASTPMAASFFNQQAGAANKSIAQSGQGVLRGAQSGGGLLGGGAFGMNKLNQASTGVGQAQNNAFNTTLNGAMNTRTASLSAMQQYRPLQTGQSSYTSGLGSWLPQLVAAGLKAGGQAAMAGG